MTMLTYKEAQLKMMDGHFCKIDGLHDVVCYYDPELRDTFRIKAGYGYDDLMPTSGYHPAHKQQVWSVAEEFDDFTIHEVKTTYAKMQPVAKMA